jgi:hypothetical protein
LGMLSNDVTFRFLGMELFRHQKPFGICLTQKRYALSILERFGMSNCKPVDSPMVPGIKLGHDGETLPEENEYAAIVGSLLYLSTMTRPDIAYAVGVLSRFISCPRDPHLQAAKRVLRYIAKDPAAGLFYKGRLSTDRRQPMLSSRMYSDADFAGDHVMRKSTLGALFTLDDFPILWRSKLQTIVAQFTCEAEFVSAAMAVREALWLQRLLYTLTRKVEGIRLFCDNETALALLNSSMLMVTGRTKHIDVQYCFVLDHVMKGDVVPKFISTKEMLADGLTKSYTGGEMSEYTIKLKMYSGLEEKNKP